MKKPDDELKEILTAAFSKYRKGEEKHGVIDIDSDPRNFLKEAEDELLDSIVYSAFEIARLRKLRARIRQAVEEPTV